MAKKKYYAVAKGKTPGIYFTWDDCKAQIEHVSGAVYKGFETLSEAESFVTGFLQVTDDNNNGKLTGVSSKTCLVAYVDGSYDDSQKRYAYGCVFVLPNEVITLNGSDGDEMYISMRNVAGEILGSENAIEWAIQRGYEKVIIYYDYEGIEKWANHIWKANKPGTIRYQQYVEEKRQKIEISFCKVTAHTGDTYNEMADKLAKEALGID